MLNIRYIREHCGLLQQVADKKGINVSIQELLERDEERRQLLRRIESLRQERNGLSEQIGKCFKEGRKDQAEQLKQEVNRNNDMLKQSESRMTEVAAQYNRLMHLAPNVVSPDTPEGLSDADNVEIRRVGEIPSFGFKPRDHVQLGELHDLVDIPRGVKMAGSRNYVLKGAGFYLHRAVQQLALDVLQAKGFTPMEVPLLVRKETLLHAGFFPLGEEQTYQVADEDKWLVGTSEASLVSCFSNELVDVSKPICLAAASTCFRREIGSAGRDVQGLYRVHQFAKVEQVVLCAGDAGLSESILQQITQNAEEILQLLELPYRVVAVCIGDMSQKNYKQYDIETWMPSRNAYGETHSSSNLQDFQARRANIRYRDDDGKLQFCHTLNNTAIATPRILIPLLEIHQQEDGSIYIPQALRAYMNGIEAIRP